MKDKLIAIKSNIKPWHWWVLSIVAFSIIGGLSIWSMTKESYEPLYSGLSTEDAKEIERYLSQSGIPYKTDETGEMISVPSSQVSAIKMELASKGLPGETNPGFELLDGTNLGSTKDDREIQYKRALKGQIEKDLINGIEAVEKATVHFETPEKENIFINDVQEESKATVVLGIKEQTKLKEDQIKGIQHLVSAAIKGLAPENVVIVDDRGSVLSSLDESYANSDNQTDIVYQTENRIKNDIIKSLSSVFGYESVEVTVRATINFDEIVRNIEKYDPQGTLVSKQTKKEESETRDESGEEVGTDANADVPEYQLEGQSNGMYSKASKEELIENFEVGKTVETIKKNPELTYLSVSVAVDQTMTEEEIEELEEYVAVAAGIADRNLDGVYDNGNVKVTPFVFKQKESAVVNPDEGKETEKVFGFSPELLIGVIAGMLLLLIILLMIIGKKRKEKILRIQQEEQQRLEAERLAQESNDLVGKIGKMKEEEDEEVMTPEDEKAMKNRQNLAKEATEAAEENPRRTAEYVNKLINEG